MKGALAERTFAENSEVDICVGDALFVGILESVEHDRFIVLMDGRVRSGAGVTLKQADASTSGRVQTCQGLGEGRGFRLAIASLTSEVRFEEGFEWPSHAFSV